MDKLEQEKSMKAKWLWSSWAHLALALVVALEIAFITFNVIFIIPKFQKLMADGMIDPLIVEDHGVSWMPGFLNELNYVGGHYTTWILLGVLVVIALFEWRVRSENKSFIRLSALGTAAVGLMVVIMLMAGSLAISFCLGVPALGRMVLPFGQEQVAALEDSIDGLEIALAASDWAAADEQADKASHVLNLLNMGPALTSLARNGDGARLDDLRAKLREAQQALGETRQAIAARNIERARTETGRARTAIEPLRTAARRR